MTRAVDLRLGKTKLDVPMLPPVVNALKQIQADIGFVWPSTSGALKHSTWDGGWRDKAYNKNGKKKVVSGVKSRSGVPDGVRFHDFRHTFCSHLVQGSWGRVFSLYEVKQLAGHSDIKVTQRYAHLAPGGPVDAFAELTAKWK